MTWSISSPPNIKHLNTVYLLHNCETNGIFTSFKVRKDTRGLFSIRSNEVLYANFIAISHGISLSLIKTGCPLNISFHRTFTRCEIFSYLQIENIAATDLDTLHQFFQNLIKKDNQDGLPEYGIITSADLPHLPNLMQALHKIIEPKVPVITINDFISTIDKGDFSGALQTLNSNDVEPHHYFYHVNSYHSEIYEFPLHRLIKTCLLKADSITEDALLALPELLLLLSLPAKYSREPLFFLIEMLKNSGKEIISSKMCRDIPILKIDKMDVFLNSSYFYRTIHPLLSTLIHADLYTDKKMEIFMLRLFNIAETQENAAYRLAVMQLIEHCISCGVSVPQIWLEKLSEKKSFSEKITALFAKDPLTDLREALSQGSENYANYKIKTGQALQIAFANQVTKFTKIDKQTSGIFLPSEIASLIGLCLFAKPTATTALEQHKDIADFKNGFSEY